MNRLDITKRPLFLGIFLGILGLLTLSSCSSPNTTTEISDPFENTNRAIHKFNESVDKVAFEPIAKGYRKGIPAPARHGVRNVLRNLKTPTNLANEILQGDIEGAGTVVTRASVNTLIGVGGLFDVAGYEGIPYHAEDFGQTLAVWGVGHGPYLVAPLLGPGSTRDYTGLAIDTFADPLNHWFFNIDEDALVYVRGAVTFIDTRESLLDVLTDLRNNAIDHYATVKSVYTQNRNNLITDGDASLNAFPDFE